MNVALITARGGSKGLPRKNIIPLASKPLISWTIEAAINAHSVDEVYVSTEDKEIAEVAMSAGAKIIKRPIELAQDHTASDPVIEHAIRFLERNGHYMKSIALLQPTSPLRTSKHIDEAYQVFEAANADCVISVFEPVYCIAKAYKLNPDGTLSGLISGQSSYMRRQDLPRSLLPNGAIYLFKPNAFKRDEGIPKSNVYPYIMREADSVDIDVEADLFSALQILEKRNE